MTSVVWTLALRGTAGLLAQGATPVEDSGGPDQALLFAGGAVALLLLIVVFSGIRPRFRANPGLVSAGSPRESAQMVESIWDQAHRLHTSLSYHQGSARSIRQELSRLRSGSGVDPGLAARLRDLEDAVSNLERHLAASVGDAAELANSLSD